MLIIYGASGFIGRALQAALTARRVPYVGFGRFTCIISKDGTSPEIADAKSPADRASLLKTFSAPKAVIFAAGAAVATTDPEILRASHLDSLREAFESLPQRWWDGLPFVYASSGLVYGRRVSPRPIRGIRTPRAQLDLWRDQAAMRGASYKAGRGDRRPQRSSASFQRHRSRQCQWDRGQCGAPSGGDLLRRSCRLSLALEHANPRSR